MLNICYLDMLCAFSYFYTDNNCLGKTVGEICHYLLDKNGLKLKELIYYNRLYNQDLEQNIPKLYNKNIDIEYPTFANNNSKKNEKDVIAFLKFMGNCEGLKDYRLVRVYSDSENFYDKYNSFINRKNGNKTYTFYNKSASEYIYVIRGSNGISQWFDNAKALNKQYSQCEQDIYDDFNKVYLKSDEKTKFIITGHSKGGLSALMLGVMLFKNGISENIKIHTIYAPLINKNRIYTLLDNDVTKFMNMVNSIEIHVGDIVSNLFLTEDFMKKFSGKIYFVGDYENGFDLWKNHEPLNKIIKNGKVIVKNNYDVNGVPKASSEPLYISKIIMRLSQIFCREDIEITNPFIVSIMKKSGLIGVNCKKGFYDNDVELMSDFIKNIKKPILIDEIYFSFETITNSEKQAFLTYNFFISMLEDDDLQELFIELFSDKNLMKKMFDSEVIALFFSTFAIKFIKAFREAEDKISRNLQLEDFKKDDIIAYISNDIIITILHSEFDDFFNNKRYKKLAKKIKNELSENLFYFGFCKVILDVFDIQCEKCTENQNKIREIDNHILSKVRGLFVNEI